jgi:Fasciclin domain
MRFRNKLLLLSFLPVGFSACKKWDDHTALTNQDLSQNLLQAVSSNSSLSKFRGYIAQAGLDTLLESSRSFTIWAPNDNALQSIDPAIVSDPVKLKAFLLNHISGQSYFTRNAQTGELRVQMLNGKYNQFSVSKFADANITAADKYVKNGVLHMIDAMTPVLQSVWEYVIANTASYAQNAYIVSLNYISFDPSQAIIDSISSTTGLPIYRPGTGLVNRNTFNDRVYDLKREDKRYTYFVIQNAGFTLESDSLKQYFNTGVTATTDSLAKFNTVKDLIVEGYYTQSTLTGATLVSRSGVAIPVNPALIVESRKLSNGIVHVLSNLNVLNLNKFKEIRIEGENPSGFFSDRTGNTNYRVRYNPATGKNFTDIFITGHGVTNYFSYYTLNNMPSMRYNVYVFGVNDFQTGAVTDSILAATSFDFANVNNIATLARLPHVVPLYTAAGAYNEVFLGQVNSTLYRRLYFLLRAQGTNPMVLDYIRLVPVL